MVVQKDLSDIEDNHKAKKAKMEDVESSSEESSSGSLSYDQNEDDIPSSWLDEDTDGRILTEHTISRVRLPQRAKDKDDRLECDDSSYVSHHAVVTVNPCLTFDVIPDEMGNSRADQYPLTMTVVAGTHRISIHRNNLFVLKLSNMHRNDETNEENKENEGSKVNEEESDSGSEYDCFKPVIECAAIRHPGLVNRVKVETLGEVTYAASWSGLENVCIWNLTRALAAVNDPYSMTTYTLENNYNESDSPPPYTYEFSFTGHSVEGKALEWSPIVPGMLASGDYNGSIYVWKPAQGGSWHVYPRPFNAHEDSVMDIKWSPKESNVMVSCSYDKSIRVWDIRAAPDKACMLTKYNAHDDGITAISWNPNDPLILSGADDGLIKIWDLRKFPEENASSRFRHHNAITSLDWHPTNRSVFATSGKEDHVTQWDLSATKDKDQKDNPEFPPQLLFIHRGQREIGELHWHKQMPGVLLSTAMNGLNVIRTFKI